MRFGIGRVVRFDLGDPEVEELHGELARVGLGEEDVRGLDVAMNDAFVVRLLKTQAALGGDAEATSGGSGPRRLIVA